MRCTQTLLATMRETPAEAEIVSHRLMLRAGLVRLLASGLYTWLRSACGCSERSKPSFARR